MLSEAGDNVHGCYAKGGYATYLLDGVHTQNYYYGIRRYPYSTDLTKNPLTFRDIDPAQASPHTGVPRSSVIGNTANEVHNMGEVWCVALWEARARLIERHGFSTGNQLILQLVTDGMNLSPVNPNFLQARDAILQADVVKNGGANLAQLWAAFARRGMGLSASSPGSSTSTGVVEAFDVPDPLQVFPASLTLTGPKGGPFQPNPVSFALTNLSTTNIAWSLNSTCVWLTPNPASGGVIGGASGTNVSFLANAAATNLGLGSHVAYVLFTNKTTGIVHPAAVAVNVVGNSMFDDFDPAIDLTQWSAFGGVVGSTVLATNYGGSVSGPNSLWFGASASRYATTLPVNTLSGGTISFSLRLASGSSSTWEKLDLPSEGIVLEASTNSGLSWIGLGTYDSYQYTNWTPVLLLIPSTAQGSSTLFRWRQMSNSGTGCDHWALDNVTIDAGPSMPRILKEPSSCFALQGGTVTFTVEATGTPTLLYQWHFEGAPLANATNSTLTLSGLTTADAGDYFVSITNAYGAVASAIAELVVFEAGNLDFQIAGLFTNNSRVIDDESIAGDDRGGIAVGQGHLFYTGDYATARYSAADLSGMTNMGRSYYAIVSDLRSQQIYSLATGTNLLGSAGGTVSALVALDNTTLQPTGDVLTLSQSVYMQTGALFAGFGRVVLWNGSRVYDILLPSGIVVDLGPLAIPYRQVSESWAFWGVAEYWDSTLSLVYVRDYKTIVRTRVPDGMTSVVGTFDNLSDMACITVSPSLGRWYFHHEYGSQFGGYYETTGYADAAFLFAAPSNTPPSILVQPVSQKVQMGLQAVFQVTGWGTTPLHYQWFHNGLPLPGATSATLVLSNVQEHHVGGYSVLVTNSFGALRSDDALLTVIYGTSTLTAVDRGWYDNTGYHDPANLNYLVGDSSSNTTIRNWFLFQVPIANYTNTVVAAQLNVYTYSISSPTGSETYRLGAVSTPYSLLQTGGSGLTNIYSDLAAGALFAEREVTTAEANGVITIPLNSTAVAAINAARGAQFALGGSISSLDAIAGNEFVFGYSTSSGTSQLVLEHGPASPIISVPPLSQTLRLGTQACLTVVAAGAAPLAYQWRKDGMNILEATNAFVCFAGVTTNDSGVYDVVVTNFLGSVTSAPATIAVYEPTPPVITQQPQDQTVGAGGTCVLSVQATGDIPLSYQWLAGGLPLAAPDQPDLTLTNIQAWQAGEYSVVVTNSLGMITSEVAVVTVTPEIPVFTLQPRSLGIFRGFDAAFNVAAVGTEPFTWQWQFNGADLESETNDSLTIGSVQPWQAGYYRVIASNIVGATASAQALLALVPVAAWGDNSAGQTNLPLELTNAVQICAGAAHNLALTRDGHVIGWGAPFGATVPAGLTNAIAIAAGGGHSLALRGDGLITAWGRNEYGQTNLPTALGNVVAVAAGANHSLALRSDGTVVAWGLNTHGQCSVPVGTSNVVAIAAGGNLSLALQGNGSILAWGENNFGQRNVPPGLAPVIAVAAGSAHALALKADGTVFAWGSNIHGQTNLPAGLSNVTAIAAGAFHSLALRRDGTVAGWGAGMTNVFSYPEFGQANVPSVVTNVTAVAAGTTHSMAFAGDSAPFITEWLLNQSVYHGRPALFRASATGALPLTYQWQFEGVDVPGATDPALFIESAAQAGNYRLVVSNEYGVAVSPEASLTLVERAPFIVSQPVSQPAYFGSQVILQVKADGSGPFAYQWRCNGTNINGATEATLVLNRIRTAQSGSYSVIVSNAFGVISSAKANVSVQQVVAWGAGVTYSSSPHYGQSRVPDGLGGIRSISGGGYHTLASAEDGSVYAWGAGTNSYYSSPHYGQSIVPLALTDTVAVAGGLYHSLALRSDGTVTAWGAGTNYYSSPNYGQSMVPAGLSNVVAITSGDYHSVALKADGLPRAWGYNSYYQTNVPASATNVVAVSARSSHTLGLRADGTVVHWGSSTSLPAVNSNFVAIAAGGSHSLALRRDGTVYSWGGYYPVPSGLSNVIDIASGTDFNLALRCDGTVVTWGATNSYGLYLVPPGLSNVVAISCGAYHSVALLGDGSPMIKFHPISTEAYLGQAASFSVGALGAALTYQWQKDGMDVVDATNATLVRNNLQDGDGGDYRVIVANDMGRLTSHVASLTLRLPVGIALDAPQLIWVSLGQASWFGQTNTSHDGVHAAQSGLVKSSQTASVQSTVTGPGVLSFWWKVSSEEWFDYLSFYLDGLEQDAISGEVDWEARTVAIPSGFHTVRWTYAKDATVSVGSDAAWLDQVRFDTNAPDIVIHPASQSVRTGNAITLWVNATGAPPLSYQWTRAGTNIPGALESSFTIQNTSRRDSDIYSVLVTNLCGSAVSSNAFIRVEVPQRMAAPARGSDGTLVLMSADYDGGLLWPEDLVRFQIQASTNLVDWVTLTNTLYLTNGCLLLVDPDVRENPLRFYRIMEQ